MTGASFLTVMGSWWSETETVAQGHLRMGSTLTQEHHGHGFRFLACGAIVVITECTHACERENIHRQEYREKFTQTFKTAILSHTHTRERNRNKFTQTDRDRQKFSLTQTDRQTNKWREKTFTGRGTERERNTETEILTHRKPQRKRDKR